MPKIGAAEDRCHSFPPEGGRPGGQLPCPPLTRGTPGGQLKPPPPRRPLFSSARAPSESVPASQLCSGRGKTRSGAKSHLTASRNPRRRQLFVRARPCPSCSPAFGVGVAVPPPVRRGRSGPHGRGGQGERARRPFPRQNP